MCDIKIKIDNILDSMNPNIKSKGDNIRFSKENYYYHSVPELNIKGYRDCKKRLRDISVNKDILKDKTVLDIGSNMGMISLECAKYAKNVCGIETSVGYVDISNLLKQYYNRDNVTFLNQSFLEHYEKSKFKYDIILALAVHNWVGVAVPEFMSMCREILTNKGMVVFESHRGKSGRRVSKMLSKGGFAVQKAAFIEKCRHVFWCIKE